MYCHKNKQAKTKMHKYQIPESVTQIDPEFPTAHPAPELIQAKAMAEERMTYDHSLEGRRHNAERVLSRLALSAEKVPAGVEAEQYQDHRRWN